MKKISINNALIFILLSVLLAVCLAAFCAGISFTKQSAYAEDGESDTTFVNYLQNGYRAESSFDETELLISVSGDDPIVEYIPKEYFMQAGQHMYIGDDYGYYIYTFLDGIFDGFVGDFTAYGNMRSIVLGFQILYASIGETTYALDGVAYRIAPVFQREYATLMPNGVNDVGIGDYSQWLDYSRTTLAFRQDVFTYTMSCELTSGASKSSGLVFPVPHYSLSIDQFLFTDVNVFYLTDIMVSASIENAQDLNAGDDGYDPEADNGCFLIGTGFEISALEYVVEEADLTGLAIHTGIAAAECLISTAIGSIPGWGTAFSIASDIFDYLLEVGDYLENDYFEQTAGNSYYGTVDIPNSKVAQIEQSGNLYKGASMRTKINDDTNVWLGNGNYYSAVFEIGSGAGGEPSYWTVVYHAVSAKATSLFTDLEQITANSSFYADTLNQVREKPLAEDVASEAYVKVPVGDTELYDKFTFTAPRNGFYSVTLDDSDGVSCQITNGDNVCQANGYGAYYFEEGKQYVIILCNTSSSLKRPTLEIGLITLEGDFNDSYSFDLPAGDEAYFRVDLANPFTNISVQGTGIQITGFSDRLDIVLNEVSGTSYDVKSENVSVIVIENQSNVQQSGSIVFSDLGQIVPNGTSNIEIGGEVRYFKFIPQAPSYIFRYGETDGAAINFTVFSPGTATAIKNIESDYVLVTGLTTGSTYWIGLYNAYGESADISLVNEAQSGSIQWLINDEVVTGDTYVMYNGQTYDVALSINGEKYYAWIEAATNAGQEYLTYFNNELIVANYTSAEIFNTGIRYEIVNNIFTGTGTDVIDGVLDIDLKHPANYVNANNLLAITDTLSHETDVDVYLRVDDPLIEQVYYQVTYENGLLQDCMISGTVDITGLSEDNTIIFNFDCSDLIVYSPLIKVTGFLYEGYEYTYSSSATQSDFSIRYGKGSGTASDPYIINCSQHYLTFIFDATAAASNNEYNYWEMTADISVSGLELFQLEEFRGSFNGNDYTLSGMEFVIEAESFASVEYVGWVHENYGTIKNLNFDDVSITGDVWHQGDWVYVGTVCGINRAGGILSDITVEGTEISVNRNLSKVGGITGVNQGTVSSCGFGKVLSLQIPSIFTNGDMGGICGENTGTINGCYVIAIMEYYPSVNNRSAGGIAGYSPSGTIGSCTLLATFTVTGSDANIYPNIGAVAGHITSSTSISNITNHLSINLDALPVSQRGNTCADGSRLYGYMG